MEKNDFLEGWNKLRAYYGKLPDIEAELSRGNQIKYDAWMATVGAFRRDVWLEAVVRCGQRVKYAPAASVLRSICFEVSNELKEKERQRLASLAVEEGQVCKWCGGTGYFFIDDDRSMYPPSAACCLCSASRDPETGRKILGKAQNDPEWVFVHDIHTWRRLKVWLAEADNDDEEVIRGF